MCADEPYVTHDFEPARRRPDCMLMGRTSPTGRYVTDDFEPTETALAATCREVSSLPVVSTLLPVRTVEAKGDGRTYSYRT